MPQRPPLAAANWFKDEDFGGRPVHVLEYDRPTSDNDDAVTQQSISVMQRLANHDTAEPAIRAAAVAVAGTLPPGPTSKEIADSIFSFCQSAVTYQHEDEMKTRFADLADYAYDQTLIAPAALLQMPRPSGDCVDFSMLCLALCRLYQLPAVLKTIAAATDSPAYSHVYVVCQIAPGSFYALDTSNGPGPGFEFALPAGKKARLWPDPADFARKNKQMSIRKLSNRRTRLGDIGDDNQAATGDPFTNDGGSTYTAAGVDPNYTGSQYSTFTPPTTYAPSTTPPSSTSPNPFTAIATTIINDASKIAAPLIRQANVQAPYYITGANGAQILYDPSTGNTVNAGNTAATTLAASNQKLILYAALAAGLLFAVSATKK